MHCIGRGHLGDLDAEFLLQRLELRLQDTAPAVLQDAVHAPGQVRRLEVQPLQEDRRRFPHLDEAVDNAAQLGGDEAAQLRDVFHVALRVARLATASPDMTGDPRDGDKR